MDLHDGSLMLLGPTMDPRQVSLGIRGLELSFGSGHAFLGIQISEHSPLDEEALERSKWSVVWMGRFVLAIHRMMHHCCAHAQVRRDFLRVFL